MSELEVLENQSLNEDSNEHQEDNQKSSRIYKLEENELRNMRKASLDAKLRNVYKIPMIRWYSKTWYGSRKTERAIDVQDTRGNTSIPLIDHSIIVEEMGKLKLFRIDELQRVHIGMIQICIEPLYIPGTDSPVQVFCMADGVCNDPIHNLLGVVTGNFYYGKLIFSIRPNVSYHLRDEHLKMTIKLCLKLALSMMEGAKPLSIATKIFYAFTTSHHKEIKTHSGEQVEIKSEFRKIAKAIPPSMISKENITLPSQIL